MAADALSVLLRVNLLLAVGVLSALALRGTMRRLFGARVAYALWLVVPAAILALGLPEQAPDAVVSYGPGRMPALTPPADYSSPILIVWALGAAVMLIVLAARQRTFVASLGALTQDSIHRGAMRASSPGTGPAIVGAIRPKLVLPSDFEATFDERERELVLAHERRHLRAGDAAMNGLIAVGKCLCWFNPLAHLGAYWIRIDQELACDAAVVALHPGQKRAYAEAMLKAQMSLALPLGCAWPAHGEHPLKLRIALLKQGVPGRMRTRIGTAVVVLLALTGGGASWAALPLSGAASAQVAKEPQRFEHVGPTEGIGSLATVTSEPATRRPAPPRRRRAAPARDVTSAVAASVPASTPAVTAAADVAATGVPDANDAPGPPPLPDAVTPEPPPVPSSPNVVNFRPAFRQRPQ